MRLLRGLDCVRRDPDVAVGTVLETDRTGKARGQLSMHLALGRARADRAPRDEVGDVLRRDHVEILAAGGQAGCVDLHEQLARDTQAVIDAETAVHVGVVDQAFPADGRARFLEVHAHHDLEVGRMAVTFGLQLACVVQRGRGIVDRAWTDHHDQPVVHAVQDAVDRLPALVHGDRCDVFAGELADQVCRRREFLDLADPQVIGHVAHGSCSVHRGSSIALVRPTWRKKTARFVAWRFGSIRFVRYARRSTLSARRKKP